MADDVRKLLERFKKASANRRLWDDHWQELGELFLPRRADFTTQRVRGEKRTEKQFDGIPMQAARMLAASMGGLLMPKSDRWFIVQTDDADVNDIPEVKIWLEDARDLMWEKIYDPAARFLQRSNEVDLDLVVFGTGVMFIGERFGRGVLDFRAHNLREAFIMENADGEIDTMMRRFRLTARQAVQKFGRDNVGAKTREALRDDHEEKEFPFLHAVMPREERNGSPRLQMPFASIWIDIESEHKIGEGGFQEFPYIVPRWDTASDEVYGRSPAMIALPDAATLMQQGKTILKAGHKVVDPPLLVPNDGVIATARTWPGAQTGYDPTILEKTRGRSPVFPLVSGADIKLGREMQNDTRGQVQAAFFRNELRLPVEGPQMTATEVLQRRSEFLRVIGPTFGRLEADYTEPLVDRVFNVMMRAGAFGPLESFPEPLRGRKVVFKFASPLTRAALQVEAAALKKTVEDLAEIAQVDPAVLDNFNNDQIARDVSTANGMPSKWLRSLDDVDEIRTQRAATEAALAEAEASAQAGEMIQNAQ